MGFVGLDPILVRLIPLKVWSKLNTRFRRYRPLKRPILMKIHNGRVAEFPLPGSDDQGGDSDCLIGVT